MTIRTPAPSATAVPRLWRHWCAVERQAFEVGAGEPCSWCGDAERAATLQLVPRPAVAPGSTPAPALALAEPHA